MCVSVRHGDPLEADVFEDEEGNGMEGATPPEEEEDFYPESSQWEAEEQTRPPLTAAPITEKVTPALSCVFYPLMFLCHHNEAVSSAGEI